jgi:hypothetical protein
MQNLKSVKIQYDGKIRKWSYVEEAGKYLRVILYIDLDGKGKLVSMIIEHAKEKANISEVSYLQMDKIVA